MIAREGVDGQPQPEHVWGAAQPGAQFVQLQVREPEVARCERSCKVCACSPARDRKAGDGGLTVAEDPCCGGRVQPTGSRRQHHPDVLRGGFQTVQGSVASSRESGAAGLTAEGLDPLSMAMRAIPKKTHECERQ
jgi:hypothetical protein